MLLKFLIYGTIGWAGEIVWTALYELYTGTRKDPLNPRIRVPMTPPERWKLAGHTYLWMFPMYGIGGLLFEPCHDSVREWHWLARGALWTAAIFAVEYACGKLLRRLGGRCPWDYSYARWHVDGLIRLDYAPVWFVFGLLLERVHDAVAALGV